MTGRGETSDRVRGLSEGADALALLVAIVHSIARRLQDLPAAIAATAHWYMDREGWCLISSAGHGVPLTRAERRVVSCQPEHAGAVIGRDALIAMLTDNVFDFDPHRLDSLIYRLRRKVAEACVEPMPLAAVHGEGYRFDPG